MMMNSSGWQVITCPLFHVGVPAILLLVGQSPQEHQHDYHHRHPQHHRDHRYRHQTRTAAPNGVHDRDPILRIWQWVLGLHEKAHAGAKIVSEV